MLITRIIPVLLMKKRGLYKGIKFKNHKYVGDPINTIRIFNEKEVDEIILLDIEASKRGYEIDFDYLKAVVSESFVPLAYGGGIRTFEDAKKLFKIGVEKVVLNTYAILNPKLIEEIANAFGTQSVVFSLDVKKGILDYHAYIKSGTKKIKDNPIKVAKLMESAGAGEIIVNSIDRDGTFLGYDTNIIRLIANSVSVQVVALGGAQNLEDFRKAIESGASACAAGSMFVFDKKHRAVIISYPKYQELKEYLGRGGSEKA